MEEQLKARLKELEVELQKAQVVFDEARAKLLRLDGEYTGIKKILNAKE